MSASPDSIQETPERTEAECVAARFACSLPEPGSMISPSSYIRGRPVQSQQAGIFAYQSDTPCKPSQLSCWVREYDAKDGIVAYGVEGCKGRLWRHVRRRPLKARRLLFTSNDSASTPKSTTSPLFPSIARLKKIQQNSASAWNRG